MIQAISLTNPKARKEYACEGCKEFKEQLPHVWSKLSLSDKKVMIRAIKYDKGKILKGMMYECQVNKYDGQIYTWRVRLDVDEVMEKYGLYSEHDDY